MYLKNSIQGITVDLVPVTVDDAEFILSVRQDKEKCKYLHQVDITLNEEINWIKNQRERNGDYFFLIRRKDGTNVGMIGLSSIKDNCGETSRFVSYGNPIENMEANLLIMDFAFNDVKLELLRGFVAKDNKVVINVQKKFGFSFDDHDLLLDNIPVRLATLTHSVYNSKRTTILNLIQRASR